MSKLKFFSVGIAAENKPLDTDYLEISPVEKFPALDGEITTNTETETTQGQNRDGQSYSSEVKSTATVKALWLPYCNGNRVSSPDVRRGAVLMIYQMADDQEKFYWTTLKNDIELRKLETVIYAFSATQTEGAPVSPENYYYLEISTHKKQVTFHTSTANGEPYSYDIVLNTEEGNFTFTDDTGNMVFIDSKAKQVKLETASGAYHELIDKDANTYIPGNYNITVDGNMTRTVKGNVTQDTSGQQDVTVTSSYALQASKNDFTAQSTNTLTATQNVLDAPTNAVNGNLSVGAGRSGSTGEGIIEGKMLFKEDVRMEKTLTVEDDVLFNAKLDVPMDEINTLKLISVEDIEAPNV